MSKCGLSLYCSKRLDEARIFLTKQKFSLELWREILPDGDFRGVVVAENPTPVIVL